MKIFHELVFDEFMEGTGLYRYPFHWWPVLGNVESVRFYGVADHVSANVNLVWVLHHYPVLDTSRTQPAPWPTVVKLFGEIVMTGGQTAIFQDSILPTDPGMPGSYAYMLICNLKTAAKAHVRIWATGRGRT